MKIILKDYLDTSLELIEFCVYDAPAVEYFEKEFEKIN